MMPWDCSLNNDPVDAVMRHVSVSSFASDEEEKKFKFKLTSPKDVTEAYQKLMTWGGEEDELHRGLYVPGPERIKGDIIKVFSSMREIVIAGGSLVEKLGNRIRNGRRPKKIGANWGGKSIKGSGQKKFVESKPLHPDVSTIWKKAVLKYPIKCLIVDCVVKSDDRKEDSDSNLAQNGDKKCEEEGGLFLVSTEIEEDE